MNFIGGSDFFRYFKIISVNNKKVKYEGRYKTKGSPGDAAKKAFTQLSKKYKTNKLVFSIKETTQGSLKKKYGLYSGEKIKLKTPLEIKYTGINKPVLIKYETKIHLVKDHKQKGGIGGLGRRPSPENLLQINNNPSLALVNNSLLNEVYSFEFYKPSIGDKQNIVCVGNLRCKFLFTRKNNFLDLVLEINENKILYEIEFKKGHIINISDIDFFKTYGIFAPIFPFADRNIVNIFKIKDFHKLITLMVGTNREFQKILKDSGLINPEDELDSLGQFGKIVLLPFYYSIQDVQNKVNKGKHQHGSFYIKNLM